MAIADSADESGHSEVFRVPAAAAGTRLDAWLHEKLLETIPDLSRSALKRWIQEERVTVDGSPAKPSSTLRVDSVVEIAIPPPPPPLPIPEDIPLDVVHLDDTFLVINKAPDIVVHPSPGGAHAGGTIVNALLNFTSDLSTEGGDFRPGIVHRLDRETSGLLVVARTDATHRILAAQFKARTVKKEYLAFCHGVPRENEGEIDLPLGRSLRDRKKMAIRVDDGGKPAHTGWRVEKTWGRFTWLRLFPTTGRTHQIRVHLKTLEHPIVCDAAYGREKQITASELRGRPPRSGEPVLLSRQALHAARISFLHPTTGLPVQFEAPLPPDLAAVWEATSDDSPPG